jgi:large subunit ribosomal protein L1
MPKHGKKFRESLSQYDREKLYEPREAMELMKQFAKANFDESVEVHMRLGIDPRHAEQQIRGVVLMPAGLGKTVRILVFAEGEAAQIAVDAGADIIGDDEVIASIQNDGFSDFNVAMAVPDMMRKIGRLGKVLGPRGLMPSPKAGTVVQPEDLARVIEEARAGRVEYRNDRTGNLHTVIGKASFDVDALMMNFTALVDAVRRAKPSAVKGAYVKKLVVTSTMGPGIKIDPNAAFALEVR